MRIYSLYCDRLMYEIVAPEGPAIELEQADREPRSFDKALFLQVGVERGDGGAVKTASDRVHRICRNVASQLVVINAFAGLATDALRAGPEEALIVTSNLQSLLLTRGYSVHAMPFGWLKRVELAAEAGLWEQRGEYVRPAQKWGPQWSHRLPADFEEAS